MKSRNEHIMEGCGRSRVVVRNGQVKEVGPSMLKSCPLAKKFSRPVVNFTKEEIKSNMEDRISTVGMFTKDRKILDSNEFVVFGASEVMSIGIKSGHLECAVLACDGAGTVIVTSPEMVQGIGGRMSGLVKTSPIQQVVKKVQDGGGKVLEPTTATIDQPRGVLLAKSLGFRKIAVTVTSSQEAEAIRKDYPNTVIFGVHLTGIAKDPARRMVETVDVISGCASRWVREIAGRSALLQAGASVPVFALTEVGKELILEQLRATKHQLLVKIEKLPYSDGKCPDPLV